jgi:hypothetical protein
VREIQITLMRLILFLAGGPALVPAINAETTPETALHQLLVSRFGNLSAAEERLASAAVNGVTADCGNLSGDDKKIRAELLAWLCTKTEATA